ncbi:MAG: hypothetical protein QNK04_17005 [Myxococcota bacterium]|nr:hypothetical protein [Myxococcota bacterium]
MLRDEAAGRNRQSVDHPGDSYTASCRPSAEGEIRVYEWSHPAYRSFQDVIWPDGWRLHLLDVY